MVRELLCGSTRFNDIRRGVPRMSATLLAQRLRKLEEVGVVRRVRGDDGWEYRPRRPGRNCVPSFCRSATGVRAGSAADSGAINSMPAS